MQGLISVALGMLDPVPDPVALVFVYTGDDLKNRVAQVAVALFLMGIRG